MEFKISNHFNLMMNQIAKDHFRWIGMMADRIICSKKQEDELPLLSLTFLKNNNILNFFSQFSRPAFPITIEKLSDAKLYGVVVSAVAPNPKINNQFLFNFDLILNRLQEEGYVPQQPCDRSGLEEGNLQHHINLCKIIEFIVVDKSLNTRLLTSDLNNLPRSFFAPKIDSKIFHLEDAISLWLSKFHCISDFSEEADKINCDKKENVKLSDRIYSIQMDASKFSKIAACLSRAFPDKINKDEILNGEDDDDIQYNIKLSKTVLDEIKAFVIEKFPTDEHLFSLFVSDLFYATRRCVKKFVTFDHQYLMEPHLPGENKNLRSPRNRKNRRDLSSKVNLNYFLSGPIDQIEDRKEDEEYNMDEARDEEICNVITPYNTLQDIKDDEEFDLDEARDEEKCNIITPHTTLQDIKDTEEFDFSEARDEERCNIITPHSTLQNIKDDEEFNMDDARDEEKYNIITPHNTLQNIKDDEEFIMKHSKGEEKCDLTQEMKDEEESIIVEEKYEEKCNDLQDMKDDEEFNMNDARDEEKCNIITPHNTLQNIKDDEEFIMKHSKGEEKCDLTQEMKDEEESIIVEEKYEEKCNDLHDMKDYEEYKLRDAVKESNCKGLLSSSNLHKLRNAPKIFRPRIELKSSKNSN